MQLDFQRILARKLLFALLAVGILTCGAIAAAVADDDQPASGHTPLGRLPGAPEHSRASADNDDNDSAAPSSGPASFVGDAYPLDYCVVTGDKLGEMGDVIYYNYKGRDIRFCCPDCIAKFEADPDTYIAKIDEGIIKQQEASYPAKTCPISGAELGSMGDTDWIVVDNVLFGLCCGGCEADVRGDPEKYIGWAHEQIEGAQAAQYPASTCPVTGEELGDNPIDYYYAGRLVRFCCTDCIAKFNADPQKYIAILDGKAPAEHEDMGGMDMHSGHSS